MRRAKQSLYFKHVTEELLEIKSLFHQQDQTEAFNLANLIHLGIGIYFTQNLFSLQYLAFHLRNFSFKVDHLFSIELWAALEKALI